MPTTHLYIFSDACPSDWLSNGQNDVWHTIVNFGLQTDPSLQPLIEANETPHKILAQDKQFTSFMTQLQSRLPSGRFRKWTTGPGYRERFCKAFGLTINEFRQTVMVNACSFQEKTLRASKQALLTAYNQHIGGVEGRGIGFEEFPDDKGRLQLKHSFVNFYGYHEIQCPENQMLVLLLMSWFVANQYKFYFHEIIHSGRYGFDKLALTVISVKLSGDDDFRRKSEQNLRNLIDPDGENTPIILTRSPQSDVSEGDLLVDNLAGWLNEAVSNPCNEFAKSAKELIHTSIWKGWNELLPSVTNLEAAPAVSRLNCTQENL